MVDNIKRISIDIDEELLKKIDDAADKDFTSRNSVMVKGAIKLANKILEEQ